MAGLAQRRCGGDQSSHGLIVLGDDDLLTGRQAVDQLGQLVLCFLDRHSRPDDRLPPDTSFFMIQTRNALFYQPLPTKLLADEGPFVLAFHKVVPVGGQKTAMRFLGRECERAPHACSHHCEFMGYI